MDSRTAIISTIVVTLGSLVVAYFTKRSAKDNAVTTGYANLTSALEKRLNDQGEEITKLQANLARQRRLLRNHEKWDWQMVDRLRRISPESIPDPPPLDIWDS
jgi:uncharacterized coiled-coil protein SlyX